MTTAAHPLTATRIERLVRTTALAWGLRFHRKA
jgi:hypothetical protein